MKREFTEAQVQRYSRHILLPEVGGKGQRRLNAAGVFIVGAGGLGSPVALYLAAAGVGRLGIIDSTGKQRVYSFILDSQLRLQLMDFSHKVEVFKSCDNITGVNERSRLFVFDQLTRHGGH